MWKKGWIYFLLLCFINTAFLPGENTDDTPYNGIDEVEEEYNNLYELIEEGFMGIVDDTPEDEDDDIPEWIKKTADFSVDHYAEILFLEINEYNEISIPVIYNFNSSFLEISSPPPKLS